MKQIIVFNNPSYIWNKRDCYTLMWNQGMRMWDTYLGNVNNFREEVLVAGMEQTDSIYQVDKDPQSISFKYIVRWRHITGV